MFTYMRFIILGARCNFGFYKYLIMKHAVISSNTFSEQRISGTPSDASPLHKRTGSNNPKQKETKNPSPDCTEHMASIGEHIRSLRLRKGYSSAEIFAYEHDLNRVSYWRMEKGSNITLKSLIRILDIHKVSLKEFFQDFE